ncbi:trypsin-like peptidase domain-containing protein [Crossiella sp. S99.1]|uniref:nSTAND1 domain-containing NTPase n=1 Tax=Crossiella sp. S99.1 TaxID=2936271 RepID=UPI001FFEB2B2|nr:trypsin-like peptidase domain-containing protein [Crossiella sp. S99.1]MCK2258263.1 trypsin-like peptidase domain-containing protein [Crossiella sp. S99.1]
MDPLAASVVRLFRGGEPLGMGCLVGPRQVLTCAHVVADALGVPLAGPAPRLPVRVDFPLVAAGEFVEATVASWDPERDVAGLVLDRTPEAAAAARVVSVDAVWGHEVRAFGVPVGHDQGVWASGVLRGSSASGMVQIDDERTGGFSLAPGFSGAPVWDHAADGVVGIVAAAERQAHRRTGYLIPAALLNQAWPELHRLALVRPPFRGLAPFTEEDADTFHGRAARTTELVTALQENRFAVLAGPSGSGKSSLALAGVAPALRRDGYRVAVVRATPSATIWTGLATALRPHLPEHSPTAEAARALLTGLAPDLLPAAEGQRKLLVLVDQFEELHHSGTEQPEDVLRALANLAGPRPGWTVTVLVTVRSDLIGVLTARSGMAQLLNERMTLLGPPAEPELREIIEAPLRAPAMPSYAPGLVERIVTHTPAGSLALLQFALTMLWERQRGGVIDHAAYDGIGGVTGAIARYAETVWQDLPDQDSARRLLCQLLSPIGETGYARRPLHAADLDPALAAVVDSLATTRLITVSDSDRGGRKVELAHEQLVHGWDRLRDWLTAEREFRSWQDTVHQQAGQWRASGREKALLPRGSTLKTALRKEKAHADQVLPGEAEYIRAGQRAHRNSLLTRIGVAALVLVLLTGSALLWRDQVTGQQARAAEARSTAALDTLKAGAERADTLTERLLINQRAAALAEPPAVRRRTDADYLGLRLAQRVMEMGGNSAASRSVSADATAAAATDGFTNRFTIRQFDRAHTDRTYTLPAEFTFANRIVILDPGHAVVSAKRLNPQSLAKGEDVVLLWDLAADREVRRLVPFPGNFNSQFPAAFLLDRTGKTLAFGESGGRTLALLALDGSGARTTLELPNPLRNEQGVGATALAARGTDTALVLDAKAADGSYPLLELSPRGTRNLPSMPGGLPVANSADDVVMGGCFKDQTVEQGVVIGIAERRFYRNLPVHGSTCRPHNQRLDTSARQLVATFRTGPDHPDVLAVWSVDGSAPDRRFAIPALGGKDEKDSWSVRAAAFQPDGSGRVVLAADNTLVGLRIPPLESIDSAVASAENLRFAPDGSRLHVQLLDGSVQTWDLNTQRRTGLVPAEQRRHPLDAFSPKSMALSPDGARLAVARRRDTATEHQFVVTVYDPATLTKITELGLGNQPVLVTPVGLTFTGGAELTTVLDRTITRWDLRTGHRLHPQATVPERRKDNVPVGVIQVFPLGETALIAESDGQVRRLRLADSAEVPDTAFTLPFEFSRDVSALAVDPAGQTLAVALPDRVELWDLTTRRLADTLALPEPAAELTLAEDETVRVRTAADLTVPENLPADNGIRPGKQPGPLTVVWRNGWFGVEEERTQTAPGGLLYQVVPAPTVLPAAAGARRAAVCAAVGPAKLSEERIAQLPEPARQVTGCP